MTYLSSILGLVLRYFACLEVLNGSSNHLGITGNAFDLTDFGACDLVGLERICLLDMRENTLPNWSIWNLELFSTLQFSKVCGLPGLKALGNTYDQTCRDVLDKCWYWPAWGEDRIARSRICWKFQDSRLWLLSLLIWTSEVALALVLTNVETLGGSVNGLKILSSAFDSTGLKVLHHILSVPAQGSP